MQPTSDKQISLYEILKAKEERAARQSELRNRLRLPLASITVNKAGKNKYDSDVIDVLYTALHKLRHSVAAAGMAIIEEQIVHSHTGPHALLAISGNANIIKQLSVSIEEETVFGRLFDIDIFDEQGEQINRLLLGLPARKCIICSQDAAVCIRSHAHPQEDIITVFDDIFNIFRAEQTRCLPEYVEIISVTALEAMLMEAACTPAPGLVDRCNSGAHNDMDFFTFIKSSCVLSTAMHRCAMAGWQHSGTPASLLPVLRIIGVEEEKEMFAATHNVNTQKGLIFLMGLLTAAAALAVRRGTPDSDTILDTVRQLCSGLVERELTGIESKQLSRKLTAGEKYYLQHGITGIRGQAESGLPIVSGKGLPTLRAALAAGLSLNDALVHTLIAIMTETEDTTILNRHDIATLKAIQQKAADILNIGGMMSKEGRLAIEKLDEDFIRQNIAPGGSADLLAATYYLYAIEQRLSSASELS